MATLNATAGASNANSYPTLDEAEIYYEMRTQVLGWENADDQEVLLMMATRTLDAMTRPHKTYIPEQGSIEAHWVTGPTWTGTPASTTQRLAWPRRGMYDANGNSLDWTITSIALGNPTVITTSRAHGRVTGEEVFIYGSNSTPLVDGAYFVTVIDATSFSILVDVTVPGTTGTMTIVPLDLKYATCELAGALGTADTTIDNDVLVKGITSLKAGSVSMTFKDMIERHVLPDMIFNLMPASWFTDEVISLTTPALFDVVSE
jgi:hypothetical protein